MRVPRVLLAGAAGLTLTLTACTTDAPTDAPEEAGSELTPDGEWFDEAEFEAQLAQREITPEGPEDQPWLQAIEPEWIDTSEFTHDAPEDATLCFSNASVSNPWRVTGFITMEQQVEALQEEGRIGEFRVSDAADDDNQQISDIQAFVDSGDCDVIIISPSTTATLTPAVETACESGVPVVVFDRGVNSDCMVTFIHPIGGYAYGADAAEFLVDELEPGSTVLALRILPGVDVLEHRWAAAQEVFADSELEVLGHEFTEGDGAMIKDLVSQHLQRGEVDGIWMDAGDGAVAALEAFEDAGQPYPVISGEDELSFMRKWQEEDLTAIAPVYSNFQWRTPVLAAGMILAGEEVPSEWILPQEPIRQDELDEYLERNAEMPSLHYAKFGGEDLPGFPEAWTDR
ncbi:MULTISPECIES: substrate-binding domain-containing protein [Nocardiopsis]|uniref:Monosaccharide-binding protein n=1 Tax=Nocardiopsis dassonvillei (strain ATCC 23218 / DSM 43111 / CIP 107115 / JCM 7437 / KCTC 9190 / NBRC 14626 / NCTC 10488 / NRRL B-5397 / IMRU 509) TaxID=446468 RepID=D7B7Q9_NOCDD|nr:MULTISPECIES: substrate-binding domain-containing protein [Nocardiopsis]ADH69454.1 monosaccharide-binding protein [Nocardiopsis dassonvillei subsp. dassonvillei DSM 43111]APC37464.1 ABC transporter substrate-binding protein [Nocardiopsis dassonvillei]NKY81409.1 ABC transporter substrate-binding protein [Nocardiopsis dassonvillei]VEI89964.1 D-ribose-binding periplasmic protein precursor [Nocardiopsis dassonvillei]